MSSPHFFAGAPEPGATVTLDKDDARHAIRSLRLGPGDRITSSDGEGALAECSITSVEGGVDAKVVGRSVAGRPTPEIAVLLAPPKGDRLAWAIQKLTEVGTDRIVLVEAARSVRRWTGDRAGKALARAEAVAREAAKQSRRRFLPALEGPHPWEVALGEAAARGPVFLLWEAARTGLASVLPERASALSLVVGPEGGIPEDDARGAEDRGAVLAALGSTILRTETAALAAASIALSTYGRLGDRGEPLDPGAASR